MEQAPDRPTVSLPSMFSLPAPGDGAGGNQLITNTQRLASIGALATTISHELMNQLGIVTAASGSLQAAAREEAVDPDTISRYAALIEQHALRSAYLLQMLQDYGVVSAVRPAVTSLHAILRDTMALVERQFVQEAGIHIIVRWPAAPLSLICDHGAVVHMLVNLLANARDAMSDHRGTVHFGCLLPAPGGASPAARGAALPDIPPEHIAFYVKDEGPGLPPGPAERIFAPFFSTKSGNGHTGLGLTIAQQIAGEHNGRIVAINNPDAAPGALFMAILAARPAAG